MSNVEEIDWHLLENGKEHHTDRYEIIHVESTPVLRRSQPFKISIIFNRAFDEATDRVRLHFDLETENPQPRLESVFENLNVTSSNKINISKSTWSLEILSQRKEKLTLLVRSPPIAAWGQWNLSVMFSSNTDSKTNVWKCPTKFWLLFNPWMKDDDVYMADTKYLDEYILNDVGKIFTTSHKKPKSLHWIYGQFASPILKVLKKLVDLKKLDEIKLASPIQLTMALTNVSHIIEGRWGEPYTGGTLPWLWTGSIPIYEEFLKTDKPTKWAQCFVYAGIFTTALRAVGIPSRNVSNFISSTTGYQTMSVNYVYDTNGQAIESPKIWNFHVWNDVWMARPDLPAGYGGWQAVDVTGDGPASVEAVKKGEICMTYGVSRIMSECNCDRVRWTKDLQGEYHLIHVDTDYVGRAILTKQPFIYDLHGDSDFLDITSLYKEPEGSKEERMAVYNAIRYCKKMSKEFEDSIANMLEEIRDNMHRFISNFRYHIDMPVIEDTVKFQLEEIKSIIYGQQYFAVLTIKNSRENAITVEACLGSTSIYYNGITAGLIKRETKSVTVKTNSEETIAVLIEPEEYSSKLVEFTIVTIHCIATVKENNYTWGNDFQFNIEMPNIAINAKKYLKLNQEGTIICQFTNLLKIRLTDCCITYEAPGIGRNVNLHVRDIMEGEEVTIELTVRPERKGEIPLKAVFTSKQLKFLSGATTLYVY